MKINYAILNTDGSLFRVVLDEEDVSGQTLAERGVLPVDATIPDGQQIDYSQGVEGSRGWHIVNGVVKPYLMAIPAKSELQIYREQVAAGYTDGATGIKLKCDEESKTLFTQQATLYQIALSAGVMSTSTIVSVWDFDGIEHTMTLTAFFGLLLRYGNYCLGLYRDYAP